MFSLFHVMIWYAQVSRQGSPPEQALHVIRQTYISGDFIPRRWVERDQSWLQPIPCGLIHSESRILTLERREKSKKHKLNGRLVLWAGGHVDREDALATPRDLLTAALERELGEEINLTTGVPELRGIVFHGGSLHFAVVFDVPAVAPLTGAVGSNEEFRISKGKSPSGYFLKLEDLDRRYNQLEAWSKLMLREILQRNELRSSGADASQLHFDLGAPSSNTPKPATSS